MKNKFIRSKITLVNYEAIYALLDLKLSREKSPNILCKYFDNVTRRVRVKCLNGDRLGGKELISFLIANSRIFDIFISYIAFKNKQIGLNHDFKAFTFVTGVGDVIFEKRNGEKLTPGNVADMIHSYCNDGTFFIT